MTAERLDCDYSVDCMWNNDEGYWEPNVSEELEYSYMKRQIPTQYSNYATSEHPILLSGGDEQDEHLVDVHEFLVGQGYKII